MLAQGLHHGIALLGAHLQHHTELFIEQGFEIEFVAAGADLACPVFPVAHVSAAVGDAVAFGHQQVDVQRHAHMAGKRHLADGGHQAAVAAVVVGEDFSTGAQRINRVDQVHQILRVVQIRHVVPHLVQRLRKDRATHAVLALAQVNQHERGVVHRR